jgi:hypothetical protein
VCGAADVRLVDFLVEGAPGNLGQVVLTYDCNFHGHRFTLHVARGPATTAQIPAWADLSHEEQALWTRIVLAEQQEREARR